MWSTHNLGLRRAKLDPECNRGFWRIPESYYTRVGGGSDLGGGLATFWGVCVTTSRSFVTVVFLPLSGGVQITTGVRVGGLTFGGPPECTI